MYRTHQDIYVYIFITILSSIHHLPCNTCVIYIYILLSLPHTNTCIYIYRLSLPLCLACPFEVAKLAKPHRASRKQHLASNVQAAKVWGEPKDETLSFDRSDNCMIIIESNIILSPCCHCKCLQDFLLSHVPPCRNQACGQTEVELEGQDLTGKEINRPLE